MYTRATIADRWGEVDGATVTRVDETAAEPTPTPTPTTRTGTATATPQPVPHIPQTGDSFPLLLIVMLTVAAAAGFATFLVLRRRSVRRKEENDPQLEPLDEPENERE